MKNILIITGVLGLGFLGGLLLKSSPKVIAQVDEPCVVIPGATTTVMITKSELQAKIAGIDTLLGDATEQLSALTAQKEELQGFLDNLK